MKTFPQANRRQLVIPASLDFSQLRLELEPVTGRLMFLPSPLGHFCLCNGLDPETVIPYEDRSCALITDWYEVHIGNGGAPDPTIEKIFERLSVNATVGG